MADDAEADPLEGFHDNRLAPHPYTQQLWAVVCGQARSEPVLAAQDPRAARPRDIPTGEFGSWGPDVGEMPFFPEGALNVLFAPGDANFSVKVKYLGFAPDGYCKRVNVCTPEEFQGAVRLLHLASERAPQQFRHWAARVCATVGAHRAPGAAAAGGAAPPAPSVFLHLLTRREEAQVAQWPGWAAPPGAREELYLRVLHSQVEAAARERRRLTWDGVWAAIRGAAGWEPMDTAPRPPPPVRLARPPGEALARALAVTEAAAAAAASAAAAVPAPSPASGKLPGGAAAVAAVAAMVVEAVEAAGGWQAGVPRAAGDGGGVPSGAGAAAKRPVDDDAPQEKRYPRQQPPNGANGRVGPPPVPPALADGPGTPESAPQDGEPGAAVGEGRPHKRRRGSPEQPADDPQAQAPSTQFVQLHPPQVLLLPLAREAEGEQPMHVDGGGDAAQPPERQRCNPQAVHAGVVLLHEPHCGGQPLGHDSGAAAAQEATAQGSGLSEEEAQPRAAACSMSPPPERAAGAPPLPSTSPPLLPPPLVTSDGGASGGAACEPIGEDAPGGAPMQQQQQQREQQQQEKEQHQEDQPQQQQEQAEEQQQGEDGAEIAGGEGAPPPPLQPPAPGPCQHGEASDSGYPVAAGESGKGAVGSPAAGEQEQTERYEAVGSGPPPRSPPPTTKWQEAAEMAGAGGIAGDGKEWPSPLGQEGRQQQRQQQPQPAHAGSTDLEATSLSEPRCMPPGIIGGPAPPALCAGSGGATPRPGGRRSSTSPPAPSSPGRSGLPSGTPAGWRAGGSSGRCDSRDHSGGGGDGTGGSLGGLMEVDGPKSGGALADPDELPASPWRCAPAAYQGGGATDAGEGAAGLRRNHAGGWEAAGAPRAAVVPARSPVTTLGSPQLGLGGGMEAAAAAAFAASGSPGGRPWPQDPEALPARAWRGAMPAPGAPSPAGRAASADAGGGSPVPDDLLAALAAAAAGGHGAGGPASPAAGGVDTAAVAPQGAGAAQASPPSPPPRRARGATGAATPARASALAARLRVLIEQRVRQFVDGPGLQAAIDAAVASRVSRLVDNLLCGGGVARGARSGLPRLSPGSGLLASRFGPGAQALINEVLGRMAGPAEGAAATAAGTARPQPAQPALRAAAGAAAAPPR